MNKFLLNKAKCYVCESGRFYTASLKERRTISQCRVWVVDHHQLNAVISHLSLWKRKVREKAFSFNMDRN